jgi:hypothetical protein
VVVPPPLVPPAAETAEQWNEVQVAPAQLQSAAVSHQLLAGVLATWHVWPAFQSQVRPPQVALQSLSTLQVDPTPTVPPVVPPPLVLAEPVVLPPPPVVDPLPPVDVPIPPVVPAPPVVVPAPPVVPLAGSTMEQWLPLQVAPLQLQSRSEEHQL